MDIRLSEDEPPEVPWTEQPDVLDLLKALNEIEDKEGLTIVGPSGRRYSVNDIIREIQEGTETGRHFVEMDNAVRAMRRKVFTTLDFHSY